MGLGRFILYYTAAEQISNSIEQKRQAQQNPNPHGVEPIGVRTAKIQVVIFRMLYYLGGLLLFIGLASAGSGIGLVLGGLAWYVFFNRYMFPLARAATLGRIGEVYRARGYDGPILDDTSIIHRIKNIHKPITEPLPWPIWYPIKYLTYPVVAAVLHTITSAVWLVQYLVPSMKTRQETLQYKKEISRNLAEITTTKRGRIWQNIKIWLKAGGQVFFVIPLWVGMIGMILEFTGIMAV